MNMAQNTMTPQELSILKEQYSHLRDMADALDRAGIETGYDILEEYALDILDAIMADHTERAKFHLNNTREDLIESGAIHFGVGTHPIWHQMVATAQSWNLENQFTRNAKAISAAVKAQYGV